MQSRQDFVNFICVFVTLREFFKIKYYNERHTNQIIFILLDNNDLK